MDLYQFKFQLCTFICQYLSIYQCSPQKSVVSIYCDRVLPLYQFYSQPPSTLKITISFKNQKKMFNIVCLFCIFSLALNYLEFTFLQFCGVWVIPLTIVLWRSRGTVQQFNQLGQIVRCFLDHVVLCNQAVVSKDVLSFLRAQISSQYL